MSGVRVTSLSSSTSRRVLIVINFSRVPVFSFGRANGVWKTNTNCSRSWTRAWRPAEARHRFTTPIRRRSPRHRCRPTCTRACRHNRNSSSNRLRTRRLCTHPRQCPPRSVSNPVVTPRGVHHDGGVSLFTGFRTLRTQSISDTVIL